MMGIAEDTQIVNRFFTVDKNPFTEIKAPGAAFSLRAAGIAGILPPKGPENTDDILERDLFLYRQSLKVV